MNISCNINAYVNGRKTKSIESEDQYDQMSVLTKKKISRKENLVNSVNQIRKKVPKFQSSEKKIKKSSKSIEDQFFDQEYFRPKQFYQFDKLFKKIESQAEDNQSKSTKLQNFLKKTIYHKFKDEKRSRYDIQNLYCLHQSILKYASGCEKKMRRAFLIVLNLSDILIDDEKLLQNNFKCESISTFDSFMNTFKQIQKYYFRQSIEDYLSIIFSHQGDSKTKLTFYQIENLFKKRMAVAEAESLAKQIKQKCQQISSLPVKEIFREQIYEICLNDTKLCQRIHEKYLKELHETNGKKL